MESTAAVSALAALAHGTRLAIFRGLVAVGPEGMAAGEIAAAHGLAASTLSHHLAALEHAGLVTATRRGRHIYYAIEIDKVRSLLAFLIEDCCQGAPELCGMARTLERRTEHA
jgi:ArsR family transcriptional regulator, arsenate/arsenite/antimonite-responsive transcriptional repressor